VLPVDRRGRGLQPARRAAFPVDGFAPVAGKGGAVGSSAQGKDPADAAIALQALQRRARFP